MVRFSIALAAGIFALATPLAAQPPASPSAPAPARIRIPFNPPLGQPLLYRVTVSDDRGTPGLEIIFDYEFTFSPRTGGGFRVSVRTVDVNMVGLSASEHRTVRQTMLPLIPPYTALFTADAVADGIENEDVYWRAIIAAGEQLMREVGAAGEGVIQLAAGMARDMPPASRRAELLKYLLPILEIAASEMVLGQDRSEDFEGPGIIGTTMVQHATLRAERVADGHLSVTGRRHAPAEQVVRSMEEALSRLPVTGEGGNTPAARERLIAQIRQTRVEHNTSLQYEVSLETGLARRYRSVTRMEISQPGRTTTESQTIRVERIGASRTL